MTCVESLRSWKLLATFLNKKAYKMKLQYTRACGDVKAKTTQFLFIFFMKIGNKIK